MLGQELFASLVEIKLRMASHEGWLDLWSVIYWIETSFFKKKSRKFISFYDFFEQFKKMSKKSILLTNAWLSVCSSHPQRTTHHFINYREAKIPSLVTN